MALDVIAAQSISVDIRGAGPDLGDSIGQCPGGGLESDDFLQNGFMLGLLWSSGDTGTVRRQRRSHCVGLWLPGERVEQRLACSGFRGSLQV
jgi:hypothetical protein